MDQLTKPHLLNNVQIIPCQRTYPSFGHAIVDIHHMYDAWKESDFLEVCTLQAPIRTSRTVRGVNEPTTGGPAILPFIVMGPGHQRHCYILR